MLRRAIHLHARQPQIGLGGRVVVALLALPFGIGALLARSWADALLFSGMFLLAGYAAVTGISLYARRRAHHSGGLPRISLPRKRRGRTAAQ